MTFAEAPQPKLSALDEPTRALIRLSAAISGGTEREIREMISQIVGQIPEAWVEELVLQSYLFAGFPRALNAMREWRRVSAVPVSRSVSQDVVQWRADGQATCAAVYGTMYARLRENIRALHPALDEWMITEGYGKVLSRPGLDLARRELCIVAACAATGQDRQLHSHLHGALNVGVEPAAVEDAVETIAGLLDADRAHSLRLLWARVRGK